ncbi:MAG: hypothetical protein KGM49_02675 [Sphingomonadales bacterium]|nr:hypothetical protein [Sphingomonadales bacterium]
MRRAAIILGLVLIAGCRREPSFDERYKAAQQRIDAKSAAIDKELASDGQASDAPGTLP